MATGQQEQHASGMAQTSVNILKSIAESWAASLAVLLHRKFGHRYLGQWAGGGAILIPLYGFFCLGRDLRPLTAFYVVYLVLFLSARISGIAQRLRGEISHSYYTGEPRLRRLLPRWSERTIKRFIEPALALGVGIWIGDHNWPLSLYLIGGGFCLFLTVNDADFHEERQAIEMNDALIAQQFATERFRELRGERSF